jgi:folate-binding protein YgfZ
MQVNTEISRGYELVRGQGAGVLDLSSRGLLSVAGSEAIQFLNGLITNDMKTLAANHWMPAVFPNVQGRLIASVRVARLKDDEFLIDTEAATYEVVSTTLKRFTFAGDFRVEELSPGTIELSVQGRQAERIVQQTLGAEAARIDRDQAIELNWSGKQLIVIRATHTGEDGFDIVVKTEEAAELRKALLAAGAVPVSDEALEVLRIEAGIARHGIDMDETNVVSETNLDDAVSFTKGCYIGQEIIARIKYRGHVAKKLTGIKFASQVPVERGAALLSKEGKEVGRLTSVAFSSALNRTVALGYVKYDYLAEGTELTAGGFTANVSALPLVEGSWTHD